MKFYLLSSLCFHKWYLGFFKDRGARGVNVDGFNEVTILAYVDDLIIFAHSHADINNKLKILNDYCTVNSLQVNTDKAKIIEFYKGRPKTEKLPFTYNSSSIEKVKPFSYLGTTFSSSWKFHLVAENHKGLPSKTRAKSSGWDEIVKVLNVIQLPYVPLKFGAFLNWKY